MGYGRYVLFRLANMFVVLILVTVISAALFYAAGEAFLWDLVMSHVNAEVSAYRQQYPTATEEEIRRFKQEREKFWMDYYGLTKPLWERVLTTTWNLMTFNFGKALQLRTPGGSDKVIDLILDRLPNTILLFTVGDLITMAIGIYLGMKAAKNVGSLLDRAISTFAMVTYSLPMWWTGMLMIMVFSYYIPNPFNPYEGLFPSGGILSPEVPPDPFLRFLDFLWHLTLPVTTLVLVSFGGWAYATRNIVLGTLQQDFVMAARAKGLPERKVLYGHVLRASSPAIATSVILSVIGSLGGAMISETVFNWPGMGNLAWMAIANMDFPVLLGWMYVTTLIWLLTLIVIDLIYGLLDPRVKVGIAVKGT
ncbi:MAG TPA: ABC transporter permease [Candidatus Bathyarchaeota archaeon]|mgnify:FL=1|nr:ABC transporter permease [Candidatus Bathyarchaeota archaeon]